VYQSFVAVDMGASGTKIISAKIDKEKNKKSIEFSELGRFPSFSYIDGGITYWDINRIVDNIKRIIRNYESENKLNSLGIDSWGVDFGMTDEYGNLLADPFHYRSMFTLKDKIKEEIEKFKPVIDAAVPTKFFPFNSVYQLLAYRKLFPEILSKTRNMLSIPSLISYVLSGKNPESIGYEFTQATTTQLFDYRKKKWSLDLLKKMNIKDILPPVMKTGSAVGNFENSNTRIILPATHDTASAFASIPTDLENTLILSLGSWCINGIVTDKIENTDEIIKYDLSVEGCADGKLRCISTTTGLWLLESIRKAWKEKYGFDKSITELIHCAQISEPFSGFIDVDDEIFQKTSDIDSEIRNYIKSHKEGKDFSPGEIVRIILEGIALKIEKTRNLLERVFNIKLDKIHSVGGGSKNRLLCQVISNITGLPLYTGPYEGSGIGNIIIQMKSLNIFSSFDETREVLKHSIEVKEFYPDNARIYQCALKKYTDFFN